MTEAESGTSVVDPPALSVTLPPSDDAESRPTGGPAANARSRTTHRRWTAAVLCLALLAALAVGIVGGLAEHRVQVAKADRRSELQAVDRQLAAARSRLAAAARTAGAVGRVLDADSAALASDQAALARAQADVHDNGVSIADLDVCLSDVEQALNSVSLGDQPLAASLLQAAAPVCRQVTTATS